MNAVVQLEDRGKVGEPMHGATAVQRRWHENREQMIATEAYYRAERRGFAPGHELEDWLDAEYQTDERLMGEGRVI